MNKTKILLLTFLLVSFAIAVSGQNITPKLNAAFQQFEKDSQLSSALVSLYIIDGKTGKVIFDKNSTIGMAPASTQKIITGATAYELLGRDFKYETKFGYSKNKSTLYIIPGGDPTLGSWRWNTTKESAILKGILQAFQKFSIKEYKTVMIDNNGWESETTPDGWIWQDIGNYYGAGAEKLNWRENQFDLILKSGSNIGDPVDIVETIPKLHGYDIVSAATSAAKGSGDNSYIYFPLSHAGGIVRGTIPINENRFVISGAMPSASGEFTSILLDTLFKAGINNPKKALVWDNLNRSVKMNTDDLVIFHTIQSPPFDSIIYWFLKKSINLYGEALAKTIAYQQKGYGSTDTAVSIIKNFWKTKGLSENELNMVDGSGLSPLNRVTTHAQVTVLQYAQSQPWFQGYYNAFPEYNGMKMKSGTIRDVKGFAGYHTSKNGTPYIFSFLVNNYNGASSTLVQKMYAVLDILK